MTNNEILDRWHDATLAFQRASEDDRPQALFRKMTAEQQAIERFGFGLHDRAYWARYPNEEQSR